MSYKSKAIAIHHSTKECVVNCDKSHKIIIGFLGDSGVGKTTAANALVSEGFYRVSIAEKVLEFTQRLFSEEEIAENKDKIFEKMRQKGNRVHKGYWLNLTLVSIPDDKDKIVLDDFTTSDLLGDVVKVYQIDRPNFTKNKLPNIESIINDSTLNSFTEKIKILGKKL